MIEVIKDTIVDGDYMSNKLGVIGGMGPLATSVFFKRIIEKTDAKSDQDHIDMIILNDTTIPDRTKAILNNDKVEFLNTIQKDIEILEFGAVKNIAIPCNTSHYFYEDLVKMTNVNIINMVSSTVRNVALNYEENSKVAILGTDGTIQSGVYAKELIENNLIVHHLGEKLQNEMMDIIYNIKSSNTYYPANFEQIVKELIHQENCACVILACTELSSIKLPEEIKPYCVDALDVLVEESIRLSDKFVKK